MKPQSAKAKGRNLQKWVVGLLLKLYPSLEEDDIKSTPMGVNGEDVQLSPAARKVIPYSIECKSNKSMAVYNWYKQAKTHIGRKKTEPIVVVKANREKPLVVVDAAYFFNLARGATRPERLLSDPDQIKKVRDALDLVDEYLNQGHSKGFIEEVDHF